MDDSTAHIAATLSRTAAVIVAGGSGERFGHPGGKQFVNLCDRPLVAWCLRAFANAGVAALVVVCPKDRHDDLRAAVDAHVPNAPRLVLALPGATRQDSVRNGLAVVPRDCEYVAIHDGARPLVTPEAIARVVARVAEDDRLVGAIAAVPSVDTIKVVDASGCITATPDRATLWCAQTPQVIRVDELRAAHQVATVQGLVGTDDASLIEALGFGSVAVVDPGCENLKVTRPEDLFLAEAVLRERGMA